MNDKRWDDLKDFIQRQKEQANAEMIMYQKDITSGEKLWQDHDMLITCCRTRWNEADLILLKMEMLLMSDI